MKGVNSFVKTLGIKTRTLNKTILVENEIYNAIIFVITLSKLFRSDNPKPNIKFVISSVSYLKSRNYTRFQSQRNANPDFEN